MKLLYIENMIVGKKYKMKTFKEIESMDKRSYHSAGAVRGMPYGKIVTVSKKNLVYVGIYECKNEFNYSPEWFEEIKKGNTNLI